MKPFHVHSLRCLNFEEQGKQAAAVRTHSWISGKAAKKAKCSNRVEHGVSEVGSHSHIWKELNTLTITYTVCVRVDCYVKQLPMA